MHLKCLQAGKTVQRDTVYLIMKIIDPDGLQLRRRGRLKRREYFARGPNYLWHLDSYDKLKTYGLCINGCIDGFSRQVIWLYVYRTSSDPKVIAGYYIEAVSAMEGCPNLVRGDMGTENGHVAQMQEFLSEQNSFIYGRSTHNQRIEAFWCMLRKECIQFWMDVLKALKDVGDFAGDPLDTSLVQFCFMTLVQTDLDRVTSVWNCHRIRRTKNQNVPNGRPIVLFSMPELYGRRDYLRPVNQGHIEACFTECSFRDGLPCDEELFELFNIYMAELFFGLSFQCTGGTAGLPCIAISYSTGSIVCRIGTYQLCRSNNDCSGKS
ncbi:uncharacterized protein LOC106150459 [Lingula anatina]|uniref:Uncharacterized protein LOC106150459 n=1 Tax=Lingula anatina TaxID=7574 RepID=A0A1S3GXZ8_LINAN|nr:uncharacterized protein LOC106150459 [Lingula anatina]|eukprot:XP_013378745.2 uncharacterized protein LOC106150459 [Lingula anatina]